jgi:hypothetical protein
MKIHQLQIQVISQIKIINNLINLKINIKLNQHKNLNNIFHQKFLLNYIKRELQIYKL